MIGYPGSQKIRQGQEYLVKKYTTFEPIYLNYQGPVEDWSKYLVGVLSMFKDKYIIFGLDDYLISHRMMPLYPVLDEGIACAKLCECTESENEEYPVTTQFTFWNRETLIWLLEQTTTPWDFEINGSKIFKQNNLKMQHWPILQYYTNSSISSRWSGIRYEGLNEEDINEIQKL